MAVLSVQWAKRQKPALWECSKSLGHWTFTPFSRLTPPPKEKSCSFLVLSFNGLGGGPDIGNNNLLLTHFSAADLILMFICDTIFFIFFFFGLDQFFKGFIALLVILLLFCVWFFSCKTWEILDPWPGTECVPPALDHLTTGPPGKSLGYYNFLSKAGPACKVFYSLYYLSVSVGNKGWTSYSSILLKSLSMTLKLAAYA